MKTSVDLISGKVDYQVAPSSQVSFVTRPPTPESPENQKIKSKSDLDLDDKDESGKRKLPDAFDTPCQTALKKKPVSPTPPPNTSSVEHKPDDDHTSDFPTVYCDELSCFLFICPYCRKVTCRQQDMRVHLNVFHGVKGDERIVYCSKCSVPFKCQSFLKSHMQSAHRNTSTSVKKTPQRRSCGKFDLQLAWRKVNRRSLGAKVKLQEKTKPYNDGALDIKTSPNMSTLEGQQLSPSDSSGRRLPNSPPEPFFVGGEGYGGVLTGDSSQYSSNDLALFVAQSGRGSEVELNNNNSNSDNAATALSEVGSELKEEIVVNTVSVSTILSTDSGDQNAQHSSSSSTQSSVAQECHSVEVDACESAQVVVKSSAESNNSPAETVDVVSNNLNDSKSEINVVCLSSGDDSDSEAESPKVKQEIIINSQGVRCMRQILAACPLCGPQGPLFGSWKSWSKHMIGHGYCVGQETKEFFEKLIYRC